jgi:predicted naringenin-chalcone synthase
MTAADTPVLVPTIVKLGSAFPRHRIAQEDLFEGLFQRWYADIPHARELFRRSGVHFKNLTWDPREVFAERNPSTSERIARFKQDVLGIAKASLKGVLDHAERERVGSFVMVSCTGYTGPTPECLLARDLELRSELRRTFIGHMGCFAAFNGLKVAMDSAIVRPDEDVLVNCTELTSLHIRPEISQEQAVIHTLFADASVSALVRMAPPGQGIQLVRSRTEHLYDTAEMMTWEVAPDGFAMTLSSYVPLVLSDKIKGFVGRLLASEGLTVDDVAHWVIHPGGPKIVQTIAASLALDDATVAPSFQVLAECGNCSSGTVLLVLQEVVRTRRPAAGEYGVMLAFGPGLTMEGMLIRF